MGLQNNPVEQLPPASLKRAAACRLESEEHYVALAFERFWQATTLPQQVELGTLGAVLRYLRAVPLPESGAREEPHVQDTNDSSQLWEILQTLLPNLREQRVASLLFHAGLDPREIVRFCSQEFPDIQEIYRLRRTIVERLLRNAATLRWQLTLLEGEPWGRDEHSVQE